MTHSDLRKIIPSDFWDMKVTEKIEKAKNTARIKFCFYQNDSKFKIHLFITHKNKYHILKCIRNWKIWSFK